jgi:hypothetical protein
LSRPILDVHDVKQRRQQRPAGRSCVGFYLWSVGVLVLFCLRLWFGGLGCTASYDLIACSGFPCTHANNRSDHGFGRAAGERYVPRRVIRMPKMHN